MNHGESLALAEFEMKRVESLYFEGKVTFKEVVDANTAFIDARIAARGGKS